MFLALVRLTIEHFFPLPTPAECILERSDRGIITVRNFAPQPVVGMVDSKVGRLRNRQRWINQIYRCLLSKIETIQEPLA